MAKNLKQKINELNEDEVTAFRGAILAWYDSHRRVLPWRALEGVNPDPYHVWLSEIMLQQTTVPAVIPYFEKFLRLWPSVYDLAAADNERIMHEWAGLGYYARARNLHKCAKQVVDQYGGRFPETQDELRKLSGIGDYTSAAIAAIAFGKPANVVDGNIERIMARYFSVEEPVPKAKPLLKEKAAYFAERQEHRSGDYAQALMDLGATICTPKSPSCVLCPVREGCLARAKGVQADLPAREKKGAKPRRYGYVYWITNEKGEVLIHKRPERGLLGGMMALPTSEWGDNRDNISSENLEFLKGNVVEDSKVHIEHIFTHFHLTLYLKKICIEQEALPEGYKWVSCEVMAECGMPTVFCKARDLFLP
tara:strand:+ start:587 stop:1681 length:1095 start_codon:yes stop_codon:yes gene_type:complete